MLRPILQNLVQKEELAFVTLGSSGQIVNLTFDAVAVPAQHPTHLTRFVVVVKAGDYQGQVNLAQTAPATLLLGNLIS